MSTVSKKDILSIRDFDSLIEFLSDKLDWPIDLSEVEVDDLAFDYSAKEIGIPEEHVAKVHAIKQLRPLVQGQPWGIFYIDFEPKSLPVTILRRILNAFVQKKRAQSATRSVWALDDLLFVATHGDQDHRGTTVARFTGANGSTVMREFTWNEQETEFHHLANYLDKLHWPGDPQDHNSWRSLWQSAFVGSKRKAIQDSKDLAEEMAAFARDIRARIRDHLKVFKSDKEPLRRLYNIFKNVLIHDINEDGFADMYAQTIAYGLFTARVSHPEGEFDLQRAVEWLPETNPFLKDLFRQCFGLVGLDDERVDIEEVGIGRLIELFQDLSRDDLTRILHEFGSKTGDPVIHFYEGFLEAYDRKIKFQRGVFYTPDPVVSYIVRSVHKLLQDKFGLALGLADTTTWKEMHDRQGITIPEDVKPETPFVQILDPAAGTGTFLKHTIELIHKTVMDKWTTEGKTDRDKQHLWNEYVSKSLLTRLYGIELMPAPYAVCHMKLGLVLRNTGYEFKDSRRLQVYLGNTFDLEIDTGQMALAGDSFERSMADEAKSARYASGAAPISVVIGNPPYAANSANNNSWIKGSVRTAYYPNDSIKEHNPKLLMDDYVKFIRFGQWKVSEMTGVGILAYITNHGYLDNPTFRRMRLSLQRSFCEVSLLDLHGNSKKQEKDTFGGKDENVFDIQQGVAILIGTSYPISEDSSFVRRSDIFGTRESKYSFLLDTNQSEVRNVAILSPKEPFHLWTVFDYTLRTEYNEGFGIQDIFTLSSNGVKTHRDGLVFDFDEQTIVRRFTRFIDQSIDDSSIKSEFNLSDTDAWSVRGARAMLSNTPNWRSFLTSCMYRPFDIQHYFAHPAVVDRPRNDVMRHIDRQDNIALVSVRQVAEGVFNHVLCSTNIVECRAMLSNKGAAYVYPLFLYPDDNQPRTLNFNIESISSVFAQKLDLTLVTEPVIWNNAKAHSSMDVFPIDVFNYIYAVLHSPTYRDRYKEFLKIDFPRIPLTSDLKLFGKLVPFGHELTQYHLLEHPNLDKTLITFPESGSNQCEKIRYDDKNERVYINKTQYFEKISQEVWNFYVGGYQVCDKWLKDRAKAKRTLTPDDILHYRKTVMALSETIRLMKEIDDAIPEWPIR